MPELTLDVAHTALSVMNFQAPIVERYAIGQDALLAATAAAIAAARQRGMRGSAPSWARISRIRTIESFVLRDGCADRDEGVHACLLEKVFPRQASVISSVELIRVLKS
jgi:hypothetical protein